jgi:hypothetical protein
VKHLDFEPGFEPAGIAGTTVGRFSVRKLSLIIRDQVLDSDSARGKLRPAAAIDDLNGFSHNLTPLACTNLYFIISRGLVDVGLVSTRRIWAGAISCHSRILPTIHPNHTVTAIKLDLEGSCA